MRAGEQQKVGVWLQLNDFGQLGADDLNAWGEKHWSFRSGVQSAAISRG
jgi:hypothetical protein